MTRLATVRSTLGHSDEVVAHPPSENHLAGLALGAIAGPLGLLFWGTMGAAAGGAAGDTGRAGAFDPLVEQVKTALPRNSSALILVAEPPTAEELTSAVGAGGQVSRQQLTDEQVEQLNDAALANQRA